MTDQLLISSIQKDMKDKAILKFPFFFCYSKIHFIIQEEEFLLKIKKMIDKIKPPCPKCPYKLGLVHTSVNPCPQCKENNYQLFEQFQKQFRGN